MDISVVIATFQRPKELAETLASVLSQHSVSIEIVVVDDSPEGSAQEVVNNAQDPRVRYLRNPEPTGGFPSIVRNLGWPLAEGALVHFLDDDDLVPEGHYAAVKAAFSQHRNVGVMFGRVAPFGNPPEDQMRAERCFARDAARGAAFCQHFGPKWAFTARMIFAMGSSSLMHGPKLSEQQVQQLRNGYRRMQAKYRAEHGAIDRLAPRRFLGLSLHGQDGPADQFPATGENRMMHSQFGKLRDPL